MTALRSRLSAVLAVSNRGSGSRQHQIGDPFSSLLNVLLKPSPVHLHLLLDAIMVHDPGCFEGADLEKIQGDLAIASRHQTSLNFGAHDLSFVLSSLTFHA